MLTKFHKYHITEIRPWPIIGATSAIRIIIALRAWIQFNTSITVNLRTIAIIIIAYQWWRDISREASSQGIHPILVVKGLKIGIILFISSEVLFFFSFFWAFFHNSISPNIEVGQIWPPNSIISFNPINVPLLNTAILLSSGVSVTWAHHSIIKNKIDKRKNSLKITVILGIYFTILQALEYSQSQFIITDSSYGSTFFIRTGFHGIHVLIGTIFLFVSIIRMNNIHNVINHLIGFEAAAWYWHFVDIVWLFLYSSIYWWGK